MGRLELRGEQSQGPSSFPDPSTVRDSSPRAVYLVFPRAGVLMRGGCHRDLSRGWQRRGPWAGSCQHLCQPGTGLLGHPLMMKLVGVPHRPALVLTPTSKSRCLTLGLCGATFPERPASGRQGPHGVSGPQVPEGPRQSLRGPQAVRGRPYRASHPEPPRLGPLSHSVSDHSPQTAISARRNPAFAGKAWPALLPSIPGTFPQQQAHDLPAGSRAAWKGPVSMPGKGAWLWGRRACWRGAGGACAPACARQGGLLWRVPARAGWWGRALRKWFASWKRKGCQFAFLALAWSLGSETALGAK